MRGKDPEIQVHRGHAGRWFWRLVATNGQTVCHSETYASRWHAEKGARAARESMAKAILVDGR